MPQPPLLIGTSDVREGATQLGVARITVGVSTFMPNAVGRHVVGLTDDQAGGVFAFFARAFGIRNIVLGAWILATRDEPKQYRRLVYQVNAAIDAADFAALLLATATRRVPKRFFALTGVLATNACWAFADLASRV